MPSARRVYPESYQRGFALIIICTIFLLIFIYWFFFIFSFSGLCVQALQEARNPITGQVKTFPTPCKVPLGWQKITQVTSSEKSLQSGETANWKTFTNEVLSVKYPPSWEVISSDSKNVVLTGKENVAKTFVAHQYSSTFNGNFENWCTQDFVCKGFTLTKKTLNEIAVYQLTSTDERGANTPGTWTYIQHGVYVYQIYWGVSALDLTNYKFSDLVAAFNNDTIFNQILSTFKFTDTISVFFNEKATKTQVDATITELKKQNEVVDIKVTTPEEALAIYKQRNSNNPALTENISAVDFPETVQVIVESSAKDKILDLVKNKSFIDRIL